VTQGETRNCLVTNQVTFGIIFKDGVYSKGVDKPLSELFA